MEIGDEDNEEDGESGIKESVRVKEGKSRGKGVAVEVDGSWAIWRKSYLGIVSTQYKTPSIYRRTNTKTHIHTDT